MRQALAISIADPADVFVGKTNAPAAVRASARGRLGAGEARARGWGSAGEKNLRRRWRRAKKPENPIKHGVSAPARPQYGQKWDLKNFKEFLLSPVDKPKKLCHTSNR